MFILPQKLKLRAHGQQVVFSKGNGESTQHVLMKIFLWALYLSEYPTMTVEIRIGDKYKPDVVALGEHGKALFWGESGQVGVAKIRSLARRYRDTHFAIAKWETNLDPLARLVTEALDGLERRAPFDLLCFREDSPNRFIGKDGYVRLSLDDLQWLRLQ